MDTISSYKNRALETLKGNWASAAVTTIFYGVIAGASSACVAHVVSGVETIWSLVLLPLGWGFTVMFLDLVRGKKLDLTAMFDGYKDFLRIFCTMLLLGVYIFLWTLLLIIPGIVKGLSYAMTPFILKDNPEMKNDEAIELSMSMMHGHKADLFWLYLSFIGWAVLCIFTLCIGFIWLIPYFETATAHFYEDLKEEYQNESVAQF